jgi:hypothetical protein
VPRQSGHAGAYVNRLVDRGGVPGRFPERSDCNCGAERSKCNQVGVVADPDIFRAAPERLLNGAGARPVESDGGQYHREAPPFFVRVRLDVSVHGPREAPCKRQPEASAFDAVVVAPR